jgi:uncharacterized SAM-binding protein YcdF (DUF218 family)
VLIALAVYALVLALAVLAVHLLSRAGSFLIINAPEPSDVIVVLDGELPQALRLQKAGYAPKILLDAGTNRLIYGKTELELAHEFLRKVKGDVQICPVAGNTTIDEIVDVRGCMDALHATSAIIVTPDFDTRRVIETFRARLPQYHWSIAASSAPYHYADQYWKHRSWAKTVLNAWENYLSWKLFDQRRPDLRMR